MIEDEELRNLYQISGEERLQKLVMGLLHLQGHPDDETTLEQLRREAHSLKGDSRSVEVESVEILARAIEEILLRLKRQQTILTPQLIDRLYQGLVAIGWLIQEAVTDQPSGIDLAEVLDHLIGEALPPQESQPEVAPEQSNLPQVAPTFIEDEELRDVYHTTSVERLQKLEAGLLHLEKRPHDEATLEQLLREAHSLKGDSRSVGLDNVEALTHTVEEILGNIKHQQTSLTQKVSDCPRGTSVADRLYQGLDAIGLLVKEAVTGQPTGVDTAQVLNHLMEVVCSPTTQESLPVPPSTPSLRAKPATQDFPAVGEPYHIDSIRVQTNELDALMTQAEELTVTKIAIAHATAEIEELAALWDDWRAFQSHRQYRDA